MEQNNCEQSGSFRCIKPPTHRGPNFAKASLGNEGRRRERVQTLEFEITYSNWNTGVRGRVRSDGTRALSKGIPFLSLCMKVRARSRAPWETFSSRFSGVFRPFWRVRS